MLKTRLRRGALACAALMIVMNLLLCGALAEDRLEVRIPAVATGADCTATLFDEDGNEVVSQTLKEGEEGALALVLHRLGSSAYTLRLTDADIDGVTYDRVVYDVVVTVYAKPSGDLGSVVEIRPYGDTAAPKRENAGFANVSKVKVIKIDPPVKKQVTGSPSTPGVFTFAMKAESNTAGLQTMPMPNGATAQQVTMQITGAGEKEFGTISLTEPGTYVYTISELAGDAAGYTYDKTVYTVTAVVTEGENGLEVTRTMTRNDGTAATEIVFTNAYTAPSPSADTADTRPTPTVPTQPTSTETVDTTPTPLPTPTIDASSTGASDDSGSASPSTSGNDSGSSSSSGTSPQTGDARHLVLWILVSVALLLVIVALVVYMVRSGRRNRRSGR